MRLKSTILILCSVIASNWSIAQKSSEENQIKEDTASVNFLLQKSKTSLSTSPDSAILLAVKAKELSEKLNYTQGKALALKNIGLGYWVARYSPVECRK